MMTNNDYYRSNDNDRADSLCRFFLLWSPDVYGEVTDAEVETRGFQILTEDLEWEEPSGSAQTIHCPSKQPLKKIKIKKNNRGSKDDDIDDDEEETLGGVTAELAKESWEVIQSFKSINSSQFHYHYYPFLFILIHSYSFIKSITRYQLVQVR